MTSAQSHVHLIGAATLLGLALSAAASAAPTGAVGSWNLKFNVNSRDRMATLTITQGDDGALAGTWVGQRGQSKLEDVKFEGGSLSFTRKLRMGKRNVGLKFDGKVEGRKLEGAMTGPRSDIPVTGFRGRPRLVAKPEPTHRDVAYGTHEQQVFDLWLAESDTPTPLVLFIHGGGFRGGSKGQVEGRALKTLLAARISVASVEYRFIKHAKLPAAHHDCRRAIQFMRSKANEWNIDKTRVAAFGGSAGAQLCMWLAFHDEMADPNSDDPIARESTRLTCVATSGGQTTMDFTWWQKHIPGCENEKPRRKPEESFDFKSEEELRAIIADISALSIISADDPPIYMQYGQKPDDPVPSDPKRARGWKIHHVMFGIKLKERMDELGVEANLQHPGRDTSYGTREKFFIAKLKGQGAE